MCDLTVQWIYFANWIASICPGLHDHTDKSFTIEQFDRWLNDLAFDMPMNMVSLCKWWTRLIPTCYEKYRLFIVNDILMWQRIHAVFNYKGSAAKAWPLIDEVLRLRWRTVWNEINYFYRFFWWYGVLCVLISKKNIQTTWALIQYKDVILPV